LGSSDMPIILGVSPWKSAHNLWLEKTGKQDPPRASYPMQRGIRLEERARELYTEHTGIDIQPCCVENSFASWMRASLDGLNDAEDIVVEIKVPGAKDHNEALKGRIPEHYIPQCDYLIAVTNAQVLHYWSFAGDEGVLVKHHPDKERIAYLINRAAAFWSCIERDVAPDMIGFI